MNGAEKYSFTFFEKIDKTFNDIIFLRQDLTLKNGDNVNASNIGLVHFIQHLEMHSVKSKLPFWVALRPILFR